MVDSSLNGAEALSELARRCAAVSVDDGTLKQSVRARLYDCGIAGLVGRLLPDSEALRNLPEDRHARLRRLVATVRATELDDIAIDGCVTAGSVVIPTALHLAAEEGAETDAIWSAIAAGYDAMIGFASAIDGANNLYRGIWPTLAAAPIGACAVAARLAGLDEARTRDAMALAIGRSVWWSDRTGPRWLMVGNAAVDGVLAAEAIAAGFAADSDVLERWATSAGVELHTTRLLPAAGPRMLDVDTKPFPTARQALCAIEAFLSLQIQAAIGADDRIIVGVPESYRAMIGREMLPTTRMETLVSVAFQIALAAHAPDRLYDVLRGRALDDPAVGALFSRISVVHDPRLDALLPGAWPGAVTIRSAAVGQREAIVTSPSISAGSDGIWTLLDAKADRLAAANAIDRSAFGELGSAIAENASAASLIRLLDWR
jgi:2-methylcitrate dehydratase PrpD